MNVKIEKALNDQLNREIYAAYLYQAMAAYAQRLNLSGFANWFDMQTKEELDHSRGFYNHILDRDGKVVLGNINQPPTDFDGPLDLFEKALAHEKSVTASIYELYDLAQKEKDFAAKTFLQWYIDEQVEEESQATEYRDKIKMVGDDGTGLMMLDQKLSTRVYTPASIIVKTE